LVDPNNAQRGEIVLYKLQFYSPQNNFRLFPEVLRQSWRSQMFGGQELWLLVMPGFHGPAR
jgi:hypothetical protein